MTAIVNDFLALQASFKAYEEKRRREIAGEPEPSKDVNAGENAEGSTPGRLSVTAREVQPPPMQQLYPVIREPRTAKQSLENWRKQWNDALLEGLKFDLETELTRRAEVENEYRRKYGIAPYVPYQNCRCVICRGK